MHVCVKAMEPIVSHDQLGFIAAVKAGMHANTQRHAPARRKEFLKTVCLPLLLPALLIYLDDENSVE